MFRSLRRRELGDIRPASVANQISVDRSRNLELSEHKEIVSAHKGGVNSLQIDQTEWRYLLAGASDGSVGVYDTIDCSSFDSASRTQRHEALFLVDRNAERGHKFVVSSVHWYPVDTGLFISGSFDHRVNVWDTNTLQVETQFKLDGKVNAVSMSPVSATHMLIAAGTEDPHLRLCDIASGAFTHTLSGHRDGIWSVQWSLSNEWVLSTGGRDGAIRFWDIRRPGSYLVLDQQKSQVGRRPPVLKKTQQGQPSMVHSSYESQGKWRKSVPKIGAAKASRMLERKSTKDLDSQIQQHPGLISSTYRATAHYGIVSALKPTPDGFFLISAGSDNRINLWDIESGCNTLVTYESTRIRGNNGIELAVSSDSSLLFVPSSTAVRAYDLWSGRLHKTLSGHYDTVNCCAFHPKDQELYSGSGDRKILVWTPSSPGPEDKKEVEESAVPPGARPDEDAWSD